MEQQARPWPRREAHRAERLAGPAVVLFDAPAPAAWPISYGVESARAGSRQRA
jgi:hypothetical protein